MLAPVLLDDFLQIPNFDVLRANWQTSLRLAKAVCRARDEGSVRAKKMPPSCLLLHGGEIGPVAREALDGEEAEVFLRLLEGLGRVRSLQGVFVWDSSAAGLGITSQL